MPTTAPVFEGATSGSDTATFELTISSVPAATDNLYVLVLSWKETSGGFINSISGLGLTWTERWTESQGSYYTAVYTAYGSGASGDITVEIFDGAFTSIVGTVARYSTAESVVEVYGSAQDKANSDDATVTVEARVKKSTVLGMYTYSGSGVTHSTTADFTARSTEAAGAGADAVNQKLEDKANTATPGNVTVGGANDLSAAADWALIAIEIIPSGSGATLEKVFEFDTGEQNWQAISGAWDAGPECGEDGVWIGPEAEFSLGDNWYRSDLTIEYTRKIRGAVVRVTVGNSTDAQYGGTFNNFVIAGLWAADSLAGPWTDIGGMSFTGACNEQPDSVLEQLENKYLRIVCSAAVSPGNYSGDLQGRVVRVEITNFIDYTEANEETGPPTASALQFYSGVNGLTYRSDLPFVTIVNPACVAVRDDGSVFVGAAAAGGGGELVVSGGSGDDYAAWTDITGSLTDPIKSLVTL